MAGGEGKIKQSQPQRRSLRFVLTLWFTAAIVVFSLAAGLCAFVAVLHEATEQVDDQLLQVAALVKRYDLPLTGLDLGDTPEIHPLAGLIIERLPAASPSQSALLKAPGGLPEGLQTLSVQGQDWRILVAVKASGERFLVAQSTALRDDTAYEGIGVMAIPLLILLLAMVLGVRTLLLRAFRPVGALAGTLDRREQSDVSPLDDAGMPTEILPFVAAINRLLERTDSLVRQQRRFVADAAHELRTPLAALSLQAERLEASGMSTEARQRLESLQGGLERAASLLEQLLTLARAQERCTGDSELVSVHGLFRQILEDFFPLAEARSLDIGVTSTKDLLVAADPDDLRVLLRNLVGNAVRYTPAGGRIDLAVQSEKETTVLTVTDTGPGIPERERKRVFEPFYRMPGSRSFGSGLGLSIVATIAKRLRGTVSLETPESEAAGSAGASPLPGLRVVLRLPAPRRCGEGEAAGDVL